MASVLKSVGSSAETLQSHIANLKPSIYLGGLLGNIQETSVASEASLFLLPSIVALGVLSFG